MPPISKDESQTEGRVDAVGDYRGKAEKFAKRLECAAFRRFLSASERGKVKAPESGALSRN